MVLSFVSRYNQHYSIQQRPCKPLFIFGNFFGGKKESKTESPSSNAPSQASPQVKAGKAADTVKIESLKGNLAKISNTQNRDYNAEALAKPVEAPKIIDRQYLCYNYNKAEEFPNLYKGWIRSDGDQIGKQIISAAKKSIVNDKLKYVEILFDPVPNLDEVAFGTTPNQRYGRNSLVVKSMDLIVFSLLFHPFFPDFAKML